MSLHVDEASADQAEDVLRVIHIGFAARPPIDPPSTASAETVDSVAKALDADGGLLATVDGEPAGAMLFDQRSLASGGGALGLRRVAVDPQFQSRGVASALVGCAEDVAVARGLDTVLLNARAELPATLQFWWRRGYVETERSGNFVVFGKALPVSVEVVSADDTRALGERIAPLLGRGDLIVLTGEVGAGKTTLTQGIGAGLQVRGAITSPTFVIARSHPSLVGGPALVHADAYRLSDITELDDLDLDTLLDETVTVVEWGEGMAEELSTDRLDVSITRRLGRPAEGGDPRRVRIVPTGPRWVGVPVRSTILAA